jgi:hypothetical protein
VRAFLGLRGTGTVGALWARQDAPGGEDQDVSVGELLFEFAGEAGGVSLGAR